MLQHGDELGRSQLGLDNGYCQDSALTWIDWRLTPEDAAFLEFTCRAFAVRRSFQTLRRATHFTGVPHRGGVRDLVWLHPSGREMTAGDWEADGAAAVAALYDGRALGEGRLLLLLNMDADPCTFVIPAKRRWTVSLTTTDLARIGESAAEVPGRSLALLQSTTEALA
jgi:glycogen operon protein